MRLNSSKRSWLGLLITVVLAGPAGLVWGDGNAHAAVPTAAPALTQQQLGRLQAVTSWDFDYTASRAVDYNGGGGTYESSSGFTVSSWDYVSDITYSIHAKGSVAGPAGCQYIFRQPLPCSLDYQEPGMYAQTFHQGNIGHVAYSDLRCPDGSLATDGLTSADTFLNGGYVPDGTPDHATSGGFGIDYSTNPPRVISDLVYTGSPGTRDETGGICGDFPSQHNDLGAGGNSFGPSLQFGDPASLGSVGDTQVRIDDQGGFVVTGFHDSSVSIPTCVTPVPPTFGVIPCLGTGSSTNIDTEHDDWTLRPHVDCPPIPEDKLTDPTVANDLVDDDGDGIPNCWEQHGIQISKADGSVITYPLPGANPKRKTVFVEVDYMQGHQPAGGTLSDVVRAFADAPVGNLDGSTGVDLYAQLGEAVPDVPQLLFTASPGDLNDFWDLKSGTATTGQPACAHGYFGTAGERNDDDCALLLAAKALVYRYALFADDQALHKGSSGVSEQGPSNDFMVTLGGWHPEWIIAAGGQEAAEAGTFMHELGHTLGLDHGGGDTINCKPNYLSVMNYVFQFPYPNRDPNRPLDYSRLALPGLNEASLDEPNGIGGPAGRLAVWGRGGVLWTDPANAAIDWDADGAAGDLGVSANINRVDTIGDCEGPSGETIDGRYGRRTFASALNAGSVPPKSAFTVFVNGAAQTPVDVRIFGASLYLTLAAPVSATDAVAFRYIKPPTDPLLRDGKGALNSSQVSADNITGRRQSLAGYDDWSNLTYAFRNSPNSVDGAGPVAHPDTPDLTGSEVAATVEAAAQAARTDATAPSTNAALDPAANAAGWNSGAVTVSLAATDPEAGDVKEISYSATGAQPTAATTVNGGSASISVTAAGSTTLTFFATDQAGNQEQPQSLTVRIDRTAPTITAAATTPPSPAGWYKADVVVHFTCTDGGSGIPAGACPQDQTLSSEGVDVQAGSRTVTDAAGNTSLPSNQVTVEIDKTAPTLTATNLAVDATSPLGATVLAYPGVAAHDNLDPGPAVACQPSLPHLFPVSPVDSVVFCSATDQAGNTAATSFTVHIRGAAEQVAMLSAASAGLGPGNSLSAKVKQIERAIAVNDGKSACSMLNAFLNEVTAQTGKSITTVHATSLTARAGNLRSALGCS
jgi:hypothetical protein